MTKLKDTKDAGFNLKTFFLEEFKGRVITTDDPNFNAREMFPDGLFDEMANLIQYNKAVMDMKTKAYLNSGVN